MHQDIQVNSIQIKITLPDWVGHEKYTEWVPTYYPQHHAWAGSYDKDVKVNKLTDALMSLDGVKEGYFHPMGSWLLFEQVDDNPMLTLEQVRVWMEAIDTVLRGYEDYHKKATA